MARPRTSATPALIAVAAVVAIVGGCSDDAGDVGAGGEEVGVAARGEPLFEANCAACHGPAGTGTAAGPPLVHDIYEPGHHGDESFQLAVARGVTAHHWDYGPMPPIEGLDRDEVADIIAYVRELQREAGIE